MGCEDVSAVKPNPIQNFNNFLISLSVSALHRLRTGEETGPAGVLAFPTQ